MSTRLRLSGLADEADPPGCCPCLFWSRTTIRPAARRWRSLRGGEVRCVPAEVQLRSVDPSKKEWLSVVSGPTAWWRPPVCLCGQANRRRSGVTARAAGGASAVRTESRWTLRADGRIRSFFLGCGRLGWVLRAAFRRSEFDVASFASVFTAVPDTAASDTITQYRVLHVLPESDAWALRLDGARGGALAQALASTVAWCALELPLPHNAAVYPDLLTDLAQRCRFPYALTPSSVLAMTARTRGSVRDGPPSVPWGPL
jgi:hypothetical protein